jgi:hypothetical protein
MKKAILPLVILVLCILFQCSDQGAKVITGTGTIYSQATDCYSILMDNGTAYEIRNLPLEFRQPDLKVRIVAQLDDSQVSICMFNRSIIKLLEIHNL